MYLMVTSFRCMLTRIEGLHVAAMSKEYSERVFSTYLLYLPTASFPSHAKSMRVRSKEGWEALQGVGQETVGGFPYLGRSLLHPAYLTSRCWNRR